MTDRIVTLIDMDCFYCQVESRDNPELCGKPAAVVQYRDWKGGGIIAVNYEARAAGVTRQMRGDDAREKCPDIALVRVPEVRGKADLTKYRNAGKEVIQVLLEFGAIVERASVDEAYVDLTNLVQERLNQNLTEEYISEKLPNTFVVGFDENEEKREEGLSTWLKQTYEDRLDGRLDDMRLAIGAMIVEEMRARVFEKTQFRCSAGIGHNKTMSKFACGMHKPNKQTILPQDQIENLFRTLKVSKLRGLGGKLGDAVEEDLNCKMLGDVAKLTMKEIRAHFDEKTSQWLHNISRGICHEPVKERDLPKSIGCSKNFRGPEALDTREKVEFWINSLCQEVSERLQIDRDANNRHARGLHVSITGESRGTISRAGPLASYDAEKLARQALSLIAKANEAPQNGDKVSWRPKLKNISVSASKFEESSQFSTTSITNFFQKKTQSDSDKDKEPVEKDPFEDDSSNTNVPVESELVDTISAEKTKHQTQSPNLAASYFQKSASKIDEDVIAVRELIPSLQNYDLSILDILPPKLKKLAKERVETLRKIEAEEKQIKTLSRSDPDLETGIENRERIDEEIVECEKCRIKISPFDLPEHLDFHVAQELQDVIRKEVRAEARVVPSVNEKSASKRKSNPEGQPQNKKQKNIMSFFQKKD